MYCNNGATKTTMPSKTVSFSDDGYVRLIEEKPDDVNFSEWVEALSLGMLDNDDEVQINN